MKEVCVYPLAAGIKLAGTQIGKKGQRNYSIGLRQTTGLDPS